MLFIDTLTRLYTELKPIVEQAFNLAYQNQSNQGDLLLIFAHGHRDPILPNGVFTGYGHMGHSMRSQMAFISEFRKLMYPNKQAYYSALQESPRTTPTEELSIQLELYVYQKLWELGMFQKRIYQLSRLISGEPYEWDGLPSRTYNNVIESMERIENPCPLLHQWIGESYDNKVRNAIAHSDFYTILEGEDKGIMFLDDSEPYYFMPLNEWNEKATKSLLLENAFSENLARYSGIYRNIADGNNGCISVSVPFTHNTNVRLAFDEPNNSWISYDNLIASGRFQ